MIVRALWPTDRREGVDSGEHSLDDFFVRHALDNHRQGISTVYVAVESAESADVLGYYTLSAASVEPDRLPAGTKLPRYPIPVFLIGRLAVDRRFRKRGVGAALLRHALGQCFEGSKHIAAYGVVVDALNEDAVRYYEPYGFQVIPPAGAWPQRMFLPMRTLEDAMR